MTRLQAVSELSGRILLVALFLISGLGKVTAYSATLGYMASAGVPGTLLPLVIAVEVFGSLSIMLGWRTRATALLLAAYTLATAVLFHANFSNPVEMVMFLKNVSIAGAFLMLAANGAGSLSFDSRIATGGRERIASVH